MKNTVIVSAVIATLFGGYAAVDALDAAAPDVRAVVEAARSSVASALPAGLGPQATVRPRWVTRPATVRRMGRRL